MAPKKNYLRQACLRKIKKGPIGIIISWILSSLYPNAALVAGDPVGAGLVRDCRILATGYNGAPSKLQHCLDIGCLREQLKVPSGERPELCRGLHARTKCRYSGGVAWSQYQGATLYCTNHPCVICAKMIINAGVVSIVIRDGYQDKLAAQMLKEARIKRKTTLSLLN